MVTMMLDKYMYIRRSCFSNIMDTIFTVVVCQRKIMVGSTKNSLLFV